MLVEWSILPVKYFSCYNMLKDLPEQNLVPQKQKYSLQLNQSTRF